MMSPTALIPAALFVLAIGVAGDLWSADAAAMPTDAQVAVQQQQQATLPLPGAAAVDAAKGKIANVLAAPELSTDKVAGHMPRLNGILMKTPEPGALDALFAQAKRPLLPALRSDGELLIAVSFSLPPETLKNLAMQADRAGAVLVLRGMVNDSLADTSKAIQAVMGDDAGDSTFQVNPNVFSAYAVQDVPTFILAKKAADGESACAAGTDYVSVRGDVTLRYALQKLGEQPGWAIAANRYSATLGATP